MSSPKVADPNGKESKLVLIVTHTQNEFRIDEIYRGLRSQNFRVDTINEDYSGQRSVGFYLDQLEGIGSASILIAGRRVPLRELVGVALNIELVVTADPDFRDVTSFNGNLRPVAVRYIENQIYGMPRSGDVAVQAIMDYLKPKDPENLQAQKLKKE